MAVTSTARTASDRLAIAHQKDVATVAGGVASAVIATAMGADPAAISFWFSAALDGLLTRIQAGYALNRRSAMGYLPQHGALNGVAVSPVPSSLDIGSTRSRLEITGPVAFKKAIAAGIDQQQALRSMATQMSGVADELVRNGDRDVIIQTMMRRGHGVVGYRRRLVGKSCGFCAMLASRGAVYSAETVTFRSHAHCRCFPEPLYRHQQEPPEVQRLQRQWRRVTAGKSGNDAMRTWRRHWEQRATPAARAREGIRELAPAPSLPAPSLPGGSAAAGAARSLEIRQVLLDARTTGAVNRAFNAEAERITGRTGLGSQRILAHFEGSAATAREHAEGILRGLERFPEARLRSVGVGRVKGSAYAEAGNERITFSYEWSKPEARKEYLDSLVFGSTRHEYGVGEFSSWHPVGTGNPAANALHEFGHTLDIDTLATRIAPDVKALVRARAPLGAEEKLIRDEVSQYAVTNTHELVAEAFSDVMVNGPAASQLSRDIFDLLEAEYRKGGFKMGPGKIGFSLPEALDNADIVRAVQSGIARSERLSGGVSGSSLVTMNDGTKLIRKTTRVDEEHAAALVARALGIGPRIYRDGDQIWIEYIDAPSAAKVRQQAVKAGGDALDAFDARVDRIAESDQGQLVGLLDQLTRNTDRNFDNWLIGAGDRPIPVDHGLTFTRGRLPEDFRLADPPRSMFDLFSGQYTTENGEHWAANRLTRQDIAEIRGRLAALEPEFEAIGRPDWLRYSRQVLDAIEPHAQGTRNLISAPGHVIARSMPAPGELSKLKLPELRALAKERGLTGYSKLTKPQLLERLGGEAKPVTVVKPAVKPAGDLSKLKVTELRALAKERGIVGYSKLTKPQLLERLGKPPAGVPPPESDLVIAARERQSAIDYARARATLLTEAEHWLDAQGSLETMTAQLRRDAKRLGIEGNRDVAALFRALDSGSEAKVRKAIDTIAGKQKLARIESAGDVVRFDRTKHAALGSGVRDGDFVVVVRPGYTFDRNGEIIRLHKATVEAATKEEIAARQLKEIVSNIKSSRNLGGGSMSDTSLVTLRNGDRYVKKTITFDYSHLPAATQADAEELGALVARAVGLDAPDVVRTAANEVYMTFMDGRLAEDSLSAALKVLDSTEGTRMRLLDYLIYNIDRSHGNWLIGADSRIQVIDHAMAFNAGTPLALAKDVYERLSATDLETLKGRITALRPQFERIGHLDWWRSTLGRLDSLTGRVSGTREIIR